MERNFEKIIQQNLEEHGDLIIGDQTFSNQIIFDEGIQCSIFGTLTFLEMDFKKIDFTGSSFWNLIFENFQIQKSDVTRASFHKGHFRNSSFIDSNLGGSIFSDLELIETKFKNNNLDSIAARSVKLWKGNQLTEVENSLKFGEILSC